MIKERGVRTFLPETEPPDLHQSVRKYPTDESGLRIIDLATKIWMEQGAKVIPGAIEGPEEYLNIIDITYSTLRDYFPKCDTPNPGQILLLSANGFEKLYDQIPPVNFVTNKTMESIGAKNLSTPPYNKKILSFHAQHIEPPLTLFNAEQIISAYKNPRFRITAEFKIIKNLICNAIGDSTIPKSLVLSDEIHTILSAMLDSESKKAPKEYPTIDKEKFKTMIDNYHLLLNEGEDPKIEAEGASLWYTSRYTTDKGSSDERVMGVGIKYNWPVSLYLSIKPMQQVIQRLIKEHPVEMQNTAKQIFSQHMSEDYVGWGLVQQFFKSIGINSDKEAFWAFHESRIPELFFEAKRKHPKLTYPR